MDLYPALPSDDSIRVLVLEPGQGDQPLAGHLETIFSLEEPTSFEAVSYVWGSSTMDRTILLNGDPHHITPNLDDALRQCRLPDRPRALWADSICINQKDLKEKAHQVTLMGRIYAASQCTLICLGTNPKKRKHARRAAAALGDINDMMDQVFGSPHFSWEPDSFPWPRWDDMLLNDPRWRSLVILTKQNWFRRGWVIQEAILARDARILWVGVQIRLLDLLRAGKWVTRRAQTFASRLGNQRDYSFWPSKMPTLLRQMFFQKSEAEAKTLYSGAKVVKGFKLLEALHDARWLEIGDPCDRIYAFMALPFVGNQMPVLRPDYEQSHLEVYRDFAVEYLEQNLDLDILCFVNHTEKTLQNPNIRSWVPQWDHHGWVSGPRVASGPRPKFGSSSAGLRNHAVRWEMDTVRPLLQVRGVIFDSVAFASPTITVETTVEEICAMWNQTSKTSSTLASFTQGEADAAHRCLAFTEALNASYVQGSSHRKWADTLKLYASFLQNSDPETLRPGGAHILPDDIHWCHRVLMEIAHRARLFMLGRGYYGVGPGVVQKGDVCAFVLGAPRPFILRKVPGAYHTNSYQLIGAVYVVGNKLDKDGIPLNLSKMLGWNDWERFRRRGEWADWGQEAQVEDILLA